MGSYQSLSWSAMDMIPVSCILSNSSFNLSDRAVGVLSLEESLGTVSHPL